MVDLAPPAPALADLLIRTTELPWPSTEQDRLPFFTALGLHDVGDPADDVEGLGAQSRRFVADLSDDLHGSATTFRGEFLGLTLFAYDEPVEHGELARVGYEAVRDRLSRRLGPPVEEWGTATEPACLWRPGALVLSMYCFQRLRSGIMVGPDHVERSDAYDEAAEASDDRHTWNEASG